MNAPFNPQPTARLLAQLRLEAQKQGLPERFADLMAGRDGMDLPRMETLAPGLVLIRDLSERQTLNAQELETAVSEYIDTLSDDENPAPEKIDRAARDVILNAMVARDPDGGRVSEPATAGFSWDHGRGLQAKLSDGLQARLDPTHEPTIGREFAQLSLAEIAMQVAGARGERPRNTRDAIRMVTGAGYHTASDFAGITADAMSNVVGRQFAQRVPDLARASREVSRLDYHEGKSLTLSASGMPKEIAEAGEIEFVTMDEKGEALPAPRDFGSGANLSNKVIANDRHDLLSKVGDRMLGGAIERMRRVLLEPLEANSGAGQTMADGDPMFSTARGNTFSSGGELSVATLSDARIALRKAEGLQGELYAIEPWAIVVPAELETTAQQVVAQIQATKFSDANPFSGSLEIIVEPGLSDPKAWYLIGNPARYDGLAHAFLDGQSAPRVEVRPGWETLGMQFRLVWALDAKFIETASWFRNPGA